ncbi:MAG: HD domain-containing protein [Candidatus Latescibacterota bacterium]|nr:HD domain-containing protein [Candidatus Latescibacterota bacterium]
MDASSRLAQQVEFLVAVDELKQVFRQTLLIRDQRRENDAEHSWHLALMALVLAEYAAEEIDLTRVMKMHLIHDLVEIHAGDTFAYDEVGNADKAEREQAAAEQIFGMLPQDQERDLRRLWDEFEERKSADARYAAALDRLQPLLLNYHAGGATWRNNGIARGRVIVRNEHIAEGAPELWIYAAQLINAAVDEGKLDP